MSILGCQSCMHARICKYLAPFVPQSQVEHHCIHITQHCSLEYLLLGSISALVMNLNQALSVSMNKKNE